MLYDEVLPLYQSVEDSNSNRSYAEMTRNIWGTQRLNNPADNFQQKDVTLVPAGSYEVSFCGFQNLGSAQYVLYKLREKYH